MASFDTLLTAERLQNEEVVGCWQLSDASKSVCDGFTENGTYRFKRPAGDWRLFVDDEELAGNDDYWHWSPGYYAGQVKAELLESTNRLTTQFLLDVSPQQGKLGKDIFQQMVEEVWEFDPSLIAGTEPAQKSAGHDHSVFDPWLQYARFRAFGLDFAEALNRIEKQPIRELRAKRFQVPLQHVRRADHQTTLAALRNPKIAAAISSSDSIPTDPNFLPLFDVPVARETLDSAANRCIAAMTQYVALRAIGLRENLAKIVENEASSETRTELASRWPRRKAFLDQLVRRLRRAQLSSPLQSVRRREMSAAGLNAVSADPLYSRTYRLGWQILRRGLAGRPEFEKLWISPTWEVYERWCFVRLCAVLTTHFPNYEWNTVQDHKSLCRTALVGNQGANSKIELLLQPKFPAIGGKARAGYESVSKAREPDIVLAMENKKTHNWFVFDAKYRTSRQNILDAMTSAHVYQDSLRYRGIRPAGSLLLVPKGGGVPQLEDLKYFAVQRVGVRAMCVESPTELHIEELLKTS